MKHRLLSCLLVVAMLVSMLVLPAAAAQPPSEQVTPDNPGAHWFYSQLSDNGKKIYDALSKMCADGKLKDGKSSLDLAENNLISQDVIRAYLNGDQTLFNDFAAAKDAYDLDHSEVWYFDSAYLSFRVTTGEDGRLHAYIGPGRANTYYLAGAESIAELEKKNTELEAVFNEIVAGARAEKVDGLPELEAQAVQVRYVHDAVTKRISYRFETECAPGNAPYVRTTYALLTHEGVCESYARSMQVILTRLGIPCVLIHGMQNSGVPEAHMWTAVRLGDDWYVVDPTWDDPIRMDKDGQVIPGTNGLDGGERQTYLLVGNDTVAQNWIPSGNVSTGAIGFTYPTICDTGYAGATVHQGQDLKVTYTTSETDGEVSGKWVASFKGMGVAKAAEQGYYLMVKQYDEHPDGTSHGMQEWYYLEAGLYVTGGVNKDFYDTDTGVVLNSATCEYAEFAVTTAPPGNYKLNPIYGNFTADESTILEQSDLLYNANSTFESAPLPYKQYPKPTSATNSQTIHRIHVEFDDDMVRPKLSSNSQNAVLEDSPEEVAKEPVDVKFATYECAYDDAGELIPHTLSIHGDHIFNNITWLYHCELEHEHSPETCKVYGVEFDFRGSKMWSDDNILYDFYITGLVGSRSSKRPQHWSWVLQTPSCPKAYRGCGIDWNLWGQPSLLDNPDDLDLNKVMLEGTDGHKESLAALQERMDVSGMNGRLMLVVDDLSVSRPNAEALSEAIESKAGLKGEDVLASSMYEIGFTRTCRETVVETGQSLRLSIGFPGDYNSESNVVFKAYHFTKDDSGNIVSVEEIPVAVTPYGLVILCNSFSPFEIVALDPSAAGADSNIKTHNIIAATDGNGLISYEIEENGVRKSVDAVGEYGFIPFDEKTTRTFTIKPNEGYAVNTVIFGAKTLKVTNNTFTLSYSDLVDTNDILNVTFVPASIKQEEAEKKESVPEMKICAHLNCESVGQTVAATCTTDGSTAGSKCKDCGQVVVEPAVVPAEGHSYVNGTCSKCGDVFQPETQPDPDPTPDPDPDPTPDPEPDPDPDPEPDPDPDPEPDPQPQPPYYYDPSWLMTYSVTVSPAEHGSVHCSTTSARVGTQVTLTVTPDEGYALSAISASFPGGAVALTANGTGGYRFTMPSGAVTVTAEFERIATQPVELPFTDVAPDCWYREAVEYMYANGIVNGTSATTFSPDGNTTRAQLITILYRLADSPEAPENVFADVTGNPNLSWSLDPIAWGTSQDIMQAYDDGLFGPNNLVTREQIVLALFNFARYMGCDVTGRSNLSGFTDAAEISGTAYEAMQWAYSVHLVQGVTETTLAPTSNVTRAQIATLLMRFCQQIIG